MSNSGDESFEKMIFEFLEDLRELIESFDKRIAAVEERLDKLEKKSSKE